MEETKTCLISGDVGWAAVDCDELEIKLIGFILIWIRLISWVVWAEVCVWRGLLSALCMNVCRVFPPQWHWVVWTCALTINSCCHIKSRLQAAGAFIVCVCVCWSHLPVYSFTIPHAASESSTSSDKSRGYRSTAAIFRLLLWLTSISQPLSNLAALRSFQQALNLVHPCQQDLG